MPNPVEDVLPAAPEEDVLPVALGEDVLPSAPVEDVLPAALVEDVLPAALVEDVLPSAPVEDVLPTASVEDLVLVQQVKVDFSSAKVSSKSSPLVASLLFSLSSGIFAPWGALWRLSPPLIVRTGQTVSLPIP